MTDLILTKKYLAHTYRIFTDRIEMIRKGKVTKILYFTISTEFTYNPNFSIMDFIRLILFLPVSSAPYCRKTFMVYNGTFKNSVSFQISYQEYELLKENLIYEIELV